MNECYNQKYKHLGLIGNITSTFCENKEPYYKVDSFDIAVLYGFLAFISFVFYATAYECNAKDYGEERYKEIVKTKYGRIMQAFSLRNNYKRLTTLTNDEESLQLRCIQGIRFFSTILVVMAHVCMINVAVPVLNTKFNEDSTTVIGNMFVANGGYLVQGFFGIAGFLTSYIFFKTFDGKKNVNISDLVLSFINRYIRLTPIVLIMVLFDATWLAHLVRGPFTDKIIYKERNSCRRNGWTNILYLNNHINKEEMCLQQTWYLAADTQVFIVAIYVTYLMFKHRKHAMKIGLAAIAVGTLIPCIVNYYENFEITTKHYPEPLWEILLTLHQWHIMFSAGYNNISGYMVGVTFGYVFYNHKKSNMVYNKMLTGLWWLATYSLPIGVILVGGIFYRDDFYATRFWSSFYVGIGRTFYSLGVLLGILGMAQGNGWIMKRLLETNYCQIFGRISFCTYLVHVTVQRLRVGELRLPVYISTSQYILQTIGDATTSLLVGFLVCLFFEMPISALQKLYIPDSKSKGNKIMDDTLNISKVNGVENNNVITEKTNGIHNNNNKKKIN